MYILSSVRITDPLPCTRIIVASQPRNGQSCLPPLAAAAAKEAGPDGADVAMGAYCTTTDCCRYTRRTGAPPRHIAMPAIRPKANVSGTATQNHCT